jgi:hypothetical protein
MQQKKEMHTPILVPVPSATKLISPLSDVTTSSDSISTPINLASSPPPSKINPWKVTPPSTPSNSGGMPSIAVAPSTLTKSLKDIMFEEEEEHEKQQLKEKVDQQQEDTNPTTIYNQQHRHHRQGKKPNLYRMKQKTSYRQSNGNHHTNNGNSHKKNQFNNHNRSPSQHQQSNYHPSNNNRLTNHSNKKKKKKQHYKSRPNRRNPRSNDYNSNYNNSPTMTNYHQQQQVQHHLQNSPAFLVPSLSEMTLSTHHQDKHPDYQYNNSNNNEGSSYTTLMSCEEYYAVTSNANIPQHESNTLGRTTKEELHRATNIISLDCEMVGVGQLGTRSALARVCIINYNNDVLLDTYVKVNEPVTDYRTFVSGVRDEDIHSDYAMEYTTCRSMVLRLLKGKVLVGHGLENDLMALCINHPKCDIRDTARYPLYMTATLVSPIESNMSVTTHNMDSSSSTSSISPFVLTPCVIESDCSSTASSNSSSSSTVPESHHHRHNHGKQQHSISATCSPRGPMMQLKPRKLKEITREWLGISIQKDGEEHSPLEDAYAALGLYKLARGQWEKSMV